MGRMYHNEMRKYIYIMSLKKYNENKSKVKITV